MSARFGSAIKHLFGNLYGIWASFLSNIFVLGPSENKTYFSHTSLLIGYNFSIYPFAPRVPPNIMPPLQNIMMSFNPFHCHRQVLTKTTWICCRPPRSNSHFYQVIQFRFPWRGHPFHPSPLPLVNNGGYPLRIRGVVWRVEAVVISIPIPSWIYVAKNKIYHRRVKIYAILIHSLIKL